MSVPLETIREITKSAIENNVITFQKYAFENEQDVENQNKFNVKQINDFIVELAHVLEDLRTGKI